MTMERPEGRHRGVGWHPRARSVPVSFCSGAVAATQVVVCGAVGKQFYTNCITGISAQSIPINRDYAQQSESVGNGNLAEVKAKGGAWWHWKRPELASLLLSCRKLAQAVACRAPGNIKSVAGIIVESIPANRGCDPDSESVKSCLLVEVKARQGVAPGGKG